MVYLSRIYTKTGDAGETSLGDGSRAAKDHTRVAAYGEIDELNSTLGVLLAQVPDYAEAGLVRRVQNDLFDAGADLCVPESPDEAAAERRPLRVAADQVKSLEQALDRVNENLEPLQSFVLPGGNAAAAWLHLARTVCRRAERAVVTLSHAGPVNPLLMQYVNRLSDLLFVLARAANRDGEDDVLWVPGQNRGG